jgi:hypothetical protein
MLTSGLLLDSTGLSIGNTTGGCGTSVGGMGGRGTAVGTAVGTELVGGVKVELVWRVGWAASSMLTLLRWLPVFMLLPWRCPPPPPLLPPLLLLLLLLPPTVGLEELAEEMADAMVLAS